MLSHWGRFLSLVILLLVLASCARPPAAGSADNSGGAVEVLDDAGRSVKLAAPATRIVSLAPSNTELVFALGGAAKVVGVDDYSDYPLEAKAIDKVGGFAKTNIEKVVSLTPDLVLATNIHVKTIVPELERRGLPVVVIQPKKVEDVLTSVGIVGKLIGRGKEADTLSQAMRQRLEAVTSKTTAASSRPKVYFELAADLFTAGPGTFVDDLIRLAGGQNIAADAPIQWPQLNAEAIITKDPEVIILSDYGQADAPEKVKARPGWQSVSAVKNNRVSKFNADYANRPGPRVLDGLDEMARMLQPGLFK